MNAIVRIVLLTLLIAGCASRNNDLFPPQGHVPDQIESQRVFVVTTRQPSPDPRIAFSGKRDEKISFADVDMSIPPIHKTGQIERARGNKRDPMKFFTAKSASAFSDEPKFVQQVAAAAKARGGRALIFVHGYNTRYDDAVYRVTQLAHDSDYPGATVLFSWASGGRTIDYVYDRDSSTVARDALESLLRTLAKSGVTRVDIIAHSMGTWVTMEALRGLAISNDRQLGGKLGDVVLASPDIDYDVFRAQMRRYGKPVRPFVVMMSGDDRALRLSGLLAGQQPRLGDYSKASDIAELGIIVADMSNVKGDDSMNHTKFAENPALLSLLGEGLKNGDRLTGGRSIDDGITTLLQTTGQTIGGVADIIITTPTTVIGTLVGG
ncbi:MAG: alpha/beta hydrolase [Mesorhizobium sp.]